MSKMSMSEAGRLGGLKLQENRIKRYNEAPKLCACCQKPLIFKQRHNKFCDHSCAATFNNRGVVRYFGGSHKLTKYCLYCGKEAKTKNKQYCSHKCFRDHRWQQIVEHIDQTGKLCSIINGAYDYNPQQAKRYLAEKRGRKCEICQGEEWLGQPMPLILDHVNGNPADNQITNLRLVCGNCNMLLPTFAGRNRGKGRESVGKTRNH